MNRIGGILIQDKLLAGARRMGLAIPHDHLIDHTIPIEKNRPVHFTLSHFISLIFIAGWETMRCQTMA